MKQKLPDAHQRLQIAAKAVVHPKTVLKCYRSQPVRSGIAARVRQAARDLQLPEPEIVLV